MDCIGEVGLTYGLSFNCSKLEKMDVLCYSSIKAIDGTEITSKESLLYLGALISKDSRITSELARRIGIASADFKNLRRCWNHTDLTMKEKLRIFYILIISKLTYGLQTAVLLAADRRKLD